MDLRFSGAVSVLTGQWGRMKRIVLAAFAAMVACQAVSADAQAGDAQDQSSEAQVEEAASIDDAVAIEPAISVEPVCELHAWPANSLRSTYHGWFHGGIADGAVQGRDGYEQLPTGPLATEVQAAQLRSLPLADMLALPDFKVIVHDEPLTSRQIRRTKGRLLTDSPPCYAEFIADDVFFQQDVIDGRFLKVLFRFRRFEGTDEPVRTFGTYSQRRLELFPPEEEPDVEASFAELAEQFSAAVGEFGEALNRPPDEKKSRKK